VQKWINDLNQLAISGTLLPKPPLLDQVRRDDPWQARQP